MENHLHIVSFDVPFPPDYGGIFEVFYKIKSLSEAGVKIHLHCFEYGRGQRKELEQYCDTVNYYERNTGHKGLSVSAPYIVSSRANEQLLKNLLADNYPILMEGIHSTYFLAFGQLANRKVIVRLHNVEYKYYKQLAKQSRSLSKKLYYWRESIMLKKYEALIAKSHALILAITEKDAATYRLDFGAKNIACLPPFIGWDFPLCQEGVGTFCLYHGNLSVPENEKVATWLLEHVFSDVEIPFVIAGKNPSAKLEKLAHKKQHTCIVANPSEKEMQDLIQKAQVNILPSFTTTGVKFKLLYSVFCGRHCVVNDQMTEGTDLGSACHIAANEDAFKSILMQLYRKPFEDEEIQLRQNLMHHYYNNTTTAKRLISWIW
ncbi:MAG TPA: glycosyltransferase family 4 protein [Chitinophagaceae bacterium]|nr:glycosyltransferase family 4 protein [Chitinophagaceae bacterium]